MRRTVAILFVSFASVLLATEGDAASAPVEDIVSKYRDAVAKQATAQKDLAADVTFEASIPKLKKEGKLNALRKISSLGRVTYKVLGFQGDDTVKKEVIARFMSTEVDSGGKRSDELAITPANYNFKYKGLQIKGSQHVHVLELKPKAKRVGLFKGEVWLDEQTYMPIRETGRLVKSPSIFIKKVDFTRDYELRDGVSYPAHMATKTDTRIVGPAELNIQYANYHPEPDQPVDEATNQRSN